VLEVKAGLPRLKYVIAFEGAAAVQRPGVIALADVESEGASGKGDVSQLEAGSPCPSLPKISRADLYIGDDRRPKGVMLSHLQHLVQCPGVPADHPDRRWRCVSLDAAAVAQL